MLSKDKIKLLLTLIILFACFYGCKLKAPYPNIFLSGTITNAKSAKIVLVSRLKSDTIDFDSKNKIETILHVNKGQYYRLIDGKNNLELFLQPGDSLYFEYNYENIFGTLKFGGKSTQINSYLANQQYNLQQSWQNINELVNLSPNAFKLFTDSVFEQQIKELAQLKTNFGDSSNAFFRLEQTTLLYEHAEKMLEYVMLSPKSYLITNNKYFSFLNNLSIEDTSLLYLPAFQHFIYTYIDWLTFNQVANKEDLLPTEITLTKMQVTARNFATGIIKDELLYNTLNDHLRFYGLNNTENLFKTFEFQCGNTQLKNQLLEPYKKYLALNDRGIAPHFMCKSLDNKTIELSDLRGSYVFIDVWATWCTPCLRETPFFEDLQHKYSNKKVVFMSISIDDTKKKWADHCLMYNKTQHQYWMPNKKKFTDDYMIKTIPHFIIIDDEGRVINANAPRPSENNNSWLDKLPEKDAL